MIKFPAIQDFRKIFVKLTLWRLEASTEAGQKILPETANGKVKHREFVVESCSSSLATVFRSSAQ